MLHLPRPPLPTLPLLLRLHKWGSSEHFSSCPRFKGHISLRKMPVPLGHPSSPNPSVVIFWNSCSAMSEMCCILKLLYERFFTFSPRGKPGDTAPASSGPVALSLTSFWSGLGGGAGVLLGSHHHCQTLLPASGSESSVTPSLIPRSHPLPPALGHAQHFPPTPAPLSPS